ncbi:MAG TPA: YlxR family protein [Micromonosporaceae bacterium]|nr:YlxR family protein [Micromonosporaceae bacterium]
MVRRAYPVRTCVGCRTRAPASELLRVVAVTGDTEGGAGPDGTTDDATTSATGRFDIVPDPTRRRPGRGAHLHFDPACLALAARRRAFGRALRIEGAIRTDAVAEFLRDHAEHDG